MSEMSKLLTVKETAEYLRVNPLTVYRLASKGQVPAVKVGRHWRIDEDALYNWLSQGFMHGKPAVLVVDDEQAVGRLFEEALSQNNYRVVLARDGEEALRTLKRFDFDLIFLDLKMPGMDGVETFRRIREVDPQVPVIIVTGYPDSDLMARALEVGPMGVMEKPVGPLEIQQAIASFARRQERRIEQSTLARKR